MSAFVAGVRKRMSPPTIPKAASHSKVRSMLTQWRYKHHSQQALLWGAPLTSAKVYNAAASRPQHSSRGAQTFVWLGLLLQADGTTRNSFTLAPGNIHDARTKRHPVCIQMCTTHQLALAAPQISTQEMP